MLLGVGGAFIAIRALRPWSVSVPFAILYFATGALVARFIGLLAEGAVQKQWFWVAVEVVIIAAAALWLRRVSGSTNSADAD